MVEAEVTESSETSIYVCHTAVCPIPAGSVSGQMFITCRLSEVFIKDVQAEMFIILFFTFVGPCIVIYFYSKTNQRHNISNLFHFGTTLYMFRTIFPSVIRSLRLYIYLMLYVPCLIWKQKNYMMSGLRCSRQTQHDLPKRRHTSTRLHGVRSQKKATFRIIPVKSPDLTFPVWSP